MWLYSPRHNPALAEVPRRVGRAGALKLATWMAFSLRREVILASSCCDSAETHSGMFSLCVANDDARWATTKGSLSLVLLLGRGGWVVMMAGWWHKGAGMRRLCNT